MSYTKRYMETNQEVPQDDYDYSYELWKEKQISMFDAMMAERDEDYYRELKDEQFERDLNAYYDNYNEIWERN